MAHHRTFQFPRRASDFEIVCMAHNYLDGRSTPFINYEIEQAKLPIHGWEKFQAELNTFQHQDGFVVNPNKRYKELRAWLAYVDLHLLFIATAQRILRDRESHLDKVPSDILTLILNHLPLSDIIVNVSGVSRHFYHTVYSDLGLLYAPKRTFTIPKHLNIWEVPCIHKYVARVNTWFPDTIIVVVDRFKVRIDYRRSELIEKISMRCHESYSWFRRLIDRNAKRLTKFCAKLQVGIATAIWGRWHP